MKWNSMTVRREGVWRQKWYFVYIPVQCKYVFIILLYQFVLTEETFDMEKISYLSKENYKKVMNVLNMMWKRLQK